MPTWHENIFANIYTCCQSTDATRDFRNEYWWAPRTKPFSFRPRHLNGVYACVCVLGVKSFKFIFCWHTLWLVDFNKIIILLVVSVQTKRGSNSFHGYRNWVAGVWQAGVCCAAPSLRWLNWINSLNGLWRISVVLGAGFFLWIGNRWLGDG